MKLPKISFSKEKHGRRFAKLSAAGSAVTPDDFTVSLRSADSMMRFSDTGRKERSGEIFSVILAAGVIISALALLLDMAYAEEFTVFTIPCVLTYMVYSLVREKTSDRVRKLVVLIFLIIAIAVFVIFRKYITGGLELIINGLYEIAEEAQSYVYDRVHVNKVGQAHPVITRRVAVAYVSSVIGFLCAVPGKKARGAVSAVIVVAISFIFAYYGLIPSVPWTAALLFTAAATAGRSRLLSSWPMLIIVMLIFGAIAYLDPGEMLGISQADEYMRDRLAFRTAYIEGYEDMYEDELEEEEEEEGRSGILEFLTGDEEGSGAVVRLVLIVLAAIALILIIAALVIHMRLDKLRKKHREGIASKIPEEAVCAMFPYAVSWLRSWGVDVANVPFSSLVTKIADLMPAGYIDRYKKMNGLWEKAAFSEHQVTESDRADMESFMKETISLTKSRADWKEKLRIRFKYAL